MRKTELNKDIEIFKEGWETAIRHAYKIIDTYDDETDIKRVITDCMRLCAQWSKETDDISSPLFRQGQETGYSNILARVLNRFQ